MSERLGVTFHIAPNTRYLFTIIVANVCWWGAFILTVMRVFEMIGASVGVVIVLMIGVGISSGLSLTRMKMERVILEAFRAGYKTMENDSKKRENVLLEVKELDK